MEEEIIYKIELNRPQAEADLKAVTNQISALKNENKQLETAIRNLQKAEGDHTATIKGATKEIEVNKQKISESAAQQKALVQVINSESNSINALRAQNKLLTAERNNLNLSTSEGRARLEEINNTLDANNAKIKENVSATEQQKINIGNYASALSGLNPAIGGFISGMQGMITAAKAFIATPLGLALAAIGLLAAPVVSFFKDTAVGADLAAKEVAGFDYVLTRFKDKVNEFGKEVANGEGTTNKLIQAQGNFIKLLAAPLLLPLQGAINKYKELSKAGNEYAETIDNIKDAQVSFSVEEAEMENQIKRLILQSKNRTLTEQERINLIDQALQKEGELQIKRKQFADDELSALLRLNEARFKSVGITQQAGETQIEFAKRLVNDLRETTLSGGDELANALADSVKKLADVEAQSIAIEEKLQNQRDAILDKAAEEAEKRADKEQKAREKRAEETRQIEEETYAYFAELAEKDRQRKQEEREKELDEEAAYYKEQEKIYREKDKKEKQREEDKRKEQLALTQRFSEQVGGIFASALSGNSKLAKEITKQLVITVLDVIGRQLSAQAIADSIVKFGPIIGPVRGAIQAGLITGIINVAKSAIAGFATGGLTGTKIVAGMGLPINRSNGDNMLATVRTGEVILNERQQAALGGSRVFRSIGVPGFAEGGKIGSTAVNQIARQSESALFQTDLLNTLSRVQTVLVLQDFEAKQAAVNGEIQRSVIIQ